MEFSKVKVEVGMSGKGVAHNPECRVLVDGKPIRLLQGIKFEMSVEDTVPHLTLKLIPDEITIDGELVVREEVDGGAVFRTAKNGEFAGAKTGAFYPDMTTGEQSNG